MDRGASLRGEDLRDLVHVQAARAEPVDRLGRKRDQAASLQDRGGLGDDHGVGQSRIEGEDTRHDAGP